MGKKDVNAIVSGAGWIGSFAGQLVEDLEDLGVSPEDIHKLGKPTKEGRALVRVCAEKIAEATNGKKSEFFRLLNGGETLVLDECDGTNIIAEAGDVFAFIDSDFKNWKADEKGPATEKTPVHVYEMEEKDGTFSQLFCSLSSDLQKLCLTQDQIIGFVKKHRNWLRTDGYGTFFLFRSNDNFFVAGVIFDSGGGLKVYVRRLTYDFVWSAGGRPRIVVPQLA